MDQTQRNNMISIADLEELLKLLHRYDVCTYSTPHLHLELGSEVEDENEKPVEQSFAGIDKTVDPERLQDVKQPDPELEEFLKGVDPAYHRFYR